LRFILSILAICLLFISCSTHKNLVSSDLSNYFNENWSHLDSDKDKIYGISLQKLYNENIIKNNSNSLIVAIIDTQIDLNQEDLKGKIWVNTKEIPDNKIDDDKNGYIDDINGWNFVGKPNGGYFSYGNFEYTRVVKRWDSYFKNKKYVSEDSLIVFEEYKSAQAKLDKSIKYYIGWKKSLDFRINHYKIVEDTINYFFPKKDYTIAKLDSLYQKYKINDKTFKQRRDDNDLDLGSLIYYKKTDLEMGDKTIEDLIGPSNQFDSIINKNLNVNFVDRDMIQDNPTKLEKGYGNNQLNLYKNLNYHSTVVSGVIAGNRNNNIGIKGFHDNIKIMPLSTSISGDEHDKDIANAIYYAVDNGAKIINMSFGKEFSLEKKWTFDAYKYAEDHNVLIVHISGNDKFDIDKNPYYPNDNDYVNKKEVVGNFINVGSISKRTDSTMVSKFSNYGKENVDIFAPGEEIYVAKPNNEYGYDSGTSLAGPMVSGTAALIWLYYPKLTVKQVKDIILESGVSIDKMVVKPGTKDEMVPFADLCKTGKVLNAYNAMQLAKKVSHQKQ
jgi:cell wall-associated protease